ncbi:MAG: hypothetical protein Q8P95_04725 [bacterium]|nr:hypothetical protein [bacterium]
MSKIQRKEQKQRQWGLSVDPNIPVVLISEIDDHIWALIREIMAGISAIGVQLVLVEPGSETQKDELKRLEKACPGWIKMLRSSEVDSEACDMTVLENLTAEKLKELRLIQLVPLAERGEIHPFDPIAEKGNGFKFEGSPWSLFVALVRAAETYRFPYDWKTVLRGMRAN